MIDPILVVGCARSGTSMTAGMINICGAFGGEMYGPSIDAGKGMFENIQIRLEVVKPYLKKIGADPMGQKPLPNNRQVFEVSQPEVDRWKETIQQLMVNQGYNDGPWFIKCTKSAMIWYIWHRAFPNAKWVIIHRNHDDIIRSCLLTRFMRAYQNAEGWSKWIEAHEQRFAEMHTAGLNIIDFWPSVLCGGDFEYARKMIEKLGLTFNEPVCRAFIEPKWFNEEGKWHGRTSR
jgi:hypothetical protein